MDEALQRCKEKSVVLHLRGIGGIGKSSLLDYWNSSIEPTIRLDCDQYTDFYSRLDIIAKGAVRVGVRLHRFDILWHIRKRFVEGVEPAKEVGRDWAKEVLVAIPFIGSLASIGGALDAIGKKVLPQLRSKYGDVGKWLQTKLGSDYIERLLEILWKEPRRAEFLYLDALLEDINSRKNSDKQILILLDHFEEVDSEKPRWRYGGKDITEAELWGVFLSSLANCVAVMASRKTVPKHAGAALDIEESELTELDKESCIELLEQLEVTEEELQDKIVSVSGGNPFVIGAICDSAKSGALVSEEIEDLRADTLEEVRLKTWRRLFSHAQDLQDIINRTGLLPFFDRRVLNIIAPNLTTDQWDRLIRLSFVRQREDKTWVLHDIVRELVVAELDDRLQTLTDEVAGLLEKASKAHEDFVLLGLSFSVQALASPRETLEKFAMKFMEVGNTYGSKLLGMLDAFKTKTEEGFIVTQSIRGWLLTFIGRIAEAEQILLEALEIVEAPLARDSDYFTGYLAIVQFPLAFLYAKSGRSSNGENLYREAIKNFSKQHKSVIEIGISSSRIILTWHLNALQYLGSHLASRHRLVEAAEIYSEALKLIDEFPESGFPFTKEQLINEVLILLVFVQIRAGKSQDAEDTFSLISGEFSDPLNELLFLRGRGWVLFKFGKPIEGEKLIRKALSGFEILYKNNPMIWKGLVVCLIRLGDILKLTGRFAEAEVTIRNAINLSRENIESEEDPLGFLYLSWTLGILATILRKIGEYTKAEEAHLESIELSRKNVKQYAGRWREELARMLNNHAVLLRMTNRNPEAENFYQDALGIMRELTNSYPESVYLIDLLCTILNNFAILLKHTERVPDAFKMQEEALLLRKQLAEQSPNVFRYRVATSLNNLGILLAENDKLKEAKDAFREALEIRRELVELSHEIYDSSLASILNNNGILFQMNKEFEEAKVAYRESIDIYEKLFTGAPTAYKEDLVRTLSNQSILLSEANDARITKVMKRLSDFGIKEAPQKHEWSEEEEEDYDPL
jgi:tetratricopeptide (TPR) repeat protein